MAIKFAKVPKAPKLKLATTRKRSILSKVLNKSISGSANAKIKAVKSIPKIKKPSKFKASKNPFSKLY